MSTYPAWTYFPKNVRPPDWVHQLAQITAAVKPDVSTLDQQDGDGKDRASDAILAHLTPGLQSLGYQVETGKGRADKITRPVLFGDNGVPEVSYDIDAFNDEYGIAVEVEAGRGAANNADYRDIVRTSLLLDANFLVLFMPVEYRSGSGAKKTVMRAYANTQKQLSAIYASQRLRLPFAGILLIGY